jgi:lysophospholipid acyltransferase (LPLAT)-like uncharacterized protein
MNGREHRQARRDAQRRVDAARELAGRNLPRRVRWRRWRRAVGGVLLSWFGPVLLRLLAATWRVRCNAGPGRDLLLCGAPALLVLWHGRMLAAMPLRGHRGRGITVLVSPSDDGGLADRALRRLGYRAVRGSLSRGGARALRELAAALTDGAQVVLTPDGPRGPRHAMNDGVAWLARARNAPIVPVAFAADRAWRLRSWDRCLIPKPFARLVVDHGDPIAAPAECDDDGLAAAGARLRAALLAAERRAFAALGVPDDLDGAA